MTASQTALKNTRESRPKDLLLCGRDAALIDLYANMLGIRRFEESLLKMFGEGVLAGTTHTYLGQEATASREID